MDGFLSGYAEMIRLCRERGAHPVMMSLPPLVADKFYRHVTRELDPAGKENVLKWMSGRTDFISNWHAWTSLHPFFCGRTISTTYAATASTPMKKAMRSWQSGCWKIISGSIRFRLVHLGQARSRTGFGLAAIKHVIKTEGPMPGQQELPLIFMDDLYAPLNPQTGTEPPVWP